MKSFLFCALCLFTTLASALDLHETHPYKVKKLNYLEINASINPATYNYLEENFKKMSKQDNPIVIIKLNTPGGLVTTTKDILTLIGSAKFPVGIWVTPEGASATSAGAIMASAAHILVMSEGTNIGAATPITMGKDIEQKDAKAKAVNDLVALVRSLSKARGRSTDQFEKMISEAMSLDAREALEKKVIDRIINSHEELLEFLNGREIVVQGSKLKVEIESTVPVKKYKMDPGQLILNIFANPTTAYVLFIIGAALIYFELQAPGGIISGALGVVCLLLAGIGFQVLPLNLGAMGLIILSFLLFVLEIYITSFGILTLAGLASLLFGSLFLFRTDNSLIDLERSAIYAVVGSVALYVGFISWYFVKTYRKHKDMFTQNHHEGIITKVNENNLFQVKVNGEIWNAKSDENLNTGDHIEVTHQDDENLILTIKKKA